MVKNFDFLHRYPIIFQKTGIFSVFERKNFDF